MTNGAVWRCALALAGGLGLQGCGGGGGGSSSPGGLQAEVAGTWDLLEIGTNDVAGWYTATISVAADGKVTVLSNVDDTGDTTLPGAGFDARLLVDAGRNVTLAGADGSPTLHGTLASSKALIVAGETINPAAPAAYGLLVLRKRVPGVVYAAADVAAFPFALHTLQAGAATGWQVGEGSTDATGQLTVSTMVDAAGTACSPTTTPCGLDAFDTLQVDGNGVVTTALDATFHGVMTPDKEAIFAVSTTDVAPPQTYQLLAVLRTGGPFAAGDLAGSYGVHAITSGPSGAGSAWFHGDLGIDAAGALTFRSFVASNGTAAPTGAVFTFDPATGAFTQATPANPSLRGRLSRGKDLYVRISGAATSASMAIAVE